MEISRQTCVPVLAHAERWGSGALGPPAPGTRSWVLDGTPSEGVYGGMGLDPTEAAAVPFTAALHEVPGEPCLPKLGPPALTQATWRLVWVRGGANGHTPGTSHTQARNKRLLGRTDCIPRNELGIEKYQW